MSFTRKKLELEVTIGGGQFGATAVDSKTLSGLRMTADLASPGGETMNVCQMRVWGMTESDMNRLTVIAMLASWEIRTP